MKILLTSALIDSNFDDRKEEYLKSIKYFKSEELLDKVSIIETVVKSGSFLETLGYDVFYSNTLNTTLRNKGVKEIIAIKKYLDQSNIVGDELVIKLTGRYRLESNLFMDSIINSDNDAYYLPVKQQIFFGCFAIKKKYFDEFINSLNIEEMENRMINIELVFANYLKSKQIKKKELEKLDLYSNINNDDVVIW